MNGKLKYAARDVTVLALCASILLALQVGKAMLLPFLPNVEPVSLFVMLFTLTFRRKVLYIIYAFALLEGVIWGFHLWWWLPYLYVWTVLAGLTWLFRANSSPVLWAALSGFFGLIFGTLFVLPQFAYGGWQAALAYWIAGIPYDLVHCAGNFILCLALWAPLKKVLGKCTEHFGLR